MSRHNRASCLAASAIVLALSFTSLLGAPAAATAGRDSAAAAYDGTLGPFLGLFFPFPVFVGVGPPVVEDWYKYNVVEGQLFQATLWMVSGGRITMYHQDATSQITTARTFNDIGGVGLADIDMIVWQTEQIYIKISPAAGVTGNQNYNLAMRAYNLTELKPGDSLATTPGPGSIHGWAYPNVIGNTIYLPQLFVSDYYWLNVSDPVGTNHALFRAQLTQTCSTAMFDLYLYQMFDRPNRNLELLNHSIAMERRSNRFAQTTAAESLDFSPALYDGLYLLRVFAVENGSWSIPPFMGAPRYTYSLSLSQLGGIEKDGNDRRADGPLFNFTAKVGGRIDGRDDSGDWFNFPLLAGDKADILVSFDRENTEITTWGLHYRAIVFDPNGTEVDDVTNWGCAGGCTYNPYLSVPTITAAMNGTYSLLLMTADGSLELWPQVTGTGGVGRNWANYEVNLQLPNRKPVQVADLPDLSMDEDTSAKLALAPFFRDPEGKFGFPSFSLAPGSTRNFTFLLTSTGNLTATPDPDYNGMDKVAIRVSDDLPANTITVWLNLTVRPVNDAPRIYASAAAAFATIIVAEDSEATVELKQIFYDIDDPSLNFTIGGVSGGHIEILINEISQVATLIPEANWNGNQFVTWTATDAALNETPFDSQIVVVPVNDPPKATGTRLERIQFDEGSEYSYNLSEHFYDVDGDPLIYYGFVDPSIADIIKVNNTNLVGTDPVMRIYVIDRYRDHYFTPGPVRITFGVRDVLNNYNPATGQNDIVEKSTFLEIVNVNDKPIVDEISPTESEVGVTEWKEGDQITFSVTSVVDPDAETQFFFKWFVNGDEVPGESTPTFVFRTVLDATRPGQYAAGNYTVSVQIFDAAGAKAAREPTWTFQVLKTNRLPSVQILKPTSPLFEEGTRIEFKGLGSDEDIEDVPLLTYTWTLTDQAGRVVTFSGIGDTRMLDPGTWNVKVTVSDGISESSRTLTITVAEHELATPGFDLAASLVGMVVAVVLVLALGRRRQGS